MRLKLNFRYSGKLTEICTLDTAYNCSDPPNPDEDQKCNLEAMDRVLSKLSPMLTNKAVSNLKFSDDIISGLFDAKDTPINLFGLFNVSLSIAKALSICKELPFYKCKANVRYISKL